MFCNKCGTEISEEHKFCPSCGNQIEKTEDTKLLSIISNKSKFSPIISLLLIVLPSISIVLGFISMFTYFDGFNVLYLSYVIIPAIFVYLIVKKKNPSVAVIIYLILSMVSQLMDSLFLYQNFNIGLLFNASNVILLLCAIVIFIDNFIKNNNTIHIVTIVLFILSIVFNTTSLRTGLTSGRFIYANYVVFIITNLIYMVSNNYGIQFDINEIKNISSVFNDTNKVVMNNTVNLRKETSEISSNNQSSKSSATTIILNVFWAIFGGLIYAFGWLVVGALWCITIIGVPIGKQCFKFAKLTLAPFGKEIVYGGNTAKVIVNIIWLILTGLWSAIAYAVTGLALCITLIGIPLGLQYFKLAKLMLMPFGATIVDKK